MLEDIFNRNRSDKASKHKYHTVYGPEFEHLREQPINVLEVGVFRGESLAAWLDYFPNATIYGIDIFTRVEPAAIDVLNDERVKWLKADSTKPTVQSMIDVAWGDIEFDIIIDDGLHTPEGNALTFSNLWPYVKDTGAYYVEDVWPIDIMDAKQMNNRWFKQFPDTYTKQKMDLFLQAIDGHTIERFDLRNQTGALDSYIIKVT